MKIPQLDKHIKMHTRKTDFTSVNDRSLKQTDLYLLNVKKRVISGATEVSAWDSSLYSSWYRITKYKKTSA